MARGDIVLVDLPQPMGGAGNGQAGNRPALVVHDNATFCFISLSTEGNRSK
jgi:mRNA-degrading endonuclease toxin of MazEF toxin-antitoxin module